MPKKTNKMYANNVKTDKKITKTRKKTTLEINNTKKKQKRKMKSQ